MMKFASIAFFMLVLFPFAALADEEAPKNAEKILGYLDSHAFLDDEQIAILQKETVGLSDYWKENYYGQYRKIGAWGWLNLALPSLGCWFVGDKNGAIGDIVWNCVGIGVFFTGYIGGATLIVAGTQNPIYMYAGIGCAILSFGGLAATIIADFSAVGSAYRYVEWYNSQLKKGLNINETESMYDNRVLVTAMNPAPASGDIVHLDLLSLRF